MNSLNPFKGNTKDENIIMISMCSALLPFYITIGGMALLFFYIIFNKKRLKTALAQKYNIVLYIFCLLTATVGFIYKNLLGIVSSLVFFALIIMINFIMESISKDFFTKLSIMISRFGIMHADYVIFEMYINRIYHGDKVYRAFGFCRNPNYLAGLMTIVLLNSIYLWLSKKDNRLITTIACLVSAFALFATGCGSAFIATFVGIAILLYLTKHYRILALYLIVFTLAAAMIFSFQNVYPRMYYIKQSFDSRLNLWKNVLEAIKKRPIFGSSWFACVNIDLYYGTIVSTRAWHAHNVFLESLLSFGIIGSIIASIFFSMFFGKLIRLHKRAERGHKPTALIISVLCSATVHMMTDMVLFWVQTSFLTAILLGAAMGAVSKKNNIEYSYFPIEK